MKIKASKAEGEQLNALVAKARGYLLMELDDPIVGKEMVWVNPDGLRYTVVAPKDGWNPTENWSQMGPIIEEYGISLWNDNGLSEGSEGKEAEIGNVWATGPTYLIAACRAFVVSRLGEEVEL